MGRFTIIDGVRAHTLDAEVNGERVRMRPESLREALGWELKEQGLCRGPLCVRLTAEARRELVSEGGIDLAEFARALDRPLALEAGEGMGALGTAAAERGAGLRSLEAPDFTLPDLDGRLHRLSDHRGKKVLLIAHASW
jgi:hypothetical protein